MKVLVACEFSQVVTQEFLKRGHDAVSCDLLPTEGNEAYHLKDNVVYHLREGWDMMIAFPPCTYLACSGARWFKERVQEQKDAIAFFMVLVNAAISKIAVENPVGIMSTKYRRPDQIIQPWMFGHGETKSTCLWLKNLERLKPTHQVSGRLDRIHRLPPSSERAKERSRTYPGIAQAMAEQWGKEDSF